MPILELDGSARALADSYALAATLDENRVAPDTVELGDVLAASDLPEAIRGAHAQTGDVFREDASLQHPDAVCLGDFN